MRRAAVALALRYLVRHARRNPFRTALAFSAVAVAAALYVAIATSERAVVQSLARQVRSLAGGADLRVASSDAVTAQTLAAVESVPGLRAAPVIEQSAVAPRLGGEVLVLGVDFRRDSRLRGYDLAVETGSAGAAIDVIGKGILVTRGFTERHGLRRGDPVALATALGEELFPIVAVVPAGRAQGELPENLVVMSLAAAQLYFDREERFDRIEVALDGADPARLRAAVAPLARVEPISSSHPLLEWQLQQFRSVLGGATLLALLVSAFVVQGTLSLSVVERVKDLAILRALGATRGAVVAGFALEAVLLGALGALLGTLAGWRLAALLVRHSAARVNLLGRVVEVAGVELEPQVVLLALAIGVASALIGAVAPAWSAASVSPLEPLGRAVFAIERRSRLGLTSGLGALAAVAAFLPVVQGSHAPAALALLVGGAFLLTPALVVLASGPPRRWLSSRSFALSVALDSLARFPHRTGLTVTALAGSLALAVTVDSALFGFASAAERWINAILPIDLTLQAHDLTRVAHSDRLLPASLLPRVATSPGVRLAYGARVRLVPYGTGAVALVALDVAEFARLRTERGVAGPADPFASKLEALRAGAVLVSENFARLHGVRSGGKVALPAASGAQSFPVAGEVEEYSWPRGVVFMDRAQYLRLWRDETLTGINVALLEGAALEAVRADLARLAPAPAAFVFSGAEAKQRFLALVRSWFHFADTTIVLALLLGAIGISNALLVSLAARSRQLAILAALGAEPAQLVRCLMLEAILMGASAGLLGALLGILVVRFPLRSMTLAQSGYVLPFAVDWRQVALTVLAGAAVAVLASLPSLGPARGRGIVQQIGYE